MPPDQQPEPPGPNRSDPVPGDGDALTEFILAQSEQGIAVPVMLFGPAPADPSVTGHAPAVVELAGRLGFDPGAVELYSADAYVLQCGLGQELLDGPIGEQP